MCQRLQSTVHPHGHVSETICTIECVFWFPLYWIASGTMPVLRLGQRFADAMRWCWGHWILSFCSFPSLSEIWKRLQDRNGIFISLCMSCLCRAQRLVTKTGNIFWGGQHAMLLANKLLNTLTSFIQMEEAQFLLPPTRHVPPAHLLPT